MRPAVLAMLILLGLGAAATAAPISIASNSIYTQNFDSLPNTGTNTWTNGSTITGWHAGRQVGVLDLETSNGSSTAGDLYSLGSTSSTERALGSVTSSGTDNIAFGAEFLNDTGAAVTFAVVTYDGEQWSDRNTDTDTLTFYYRIGGVASFNLHNTLVGWNAVSALNFNSPINTGANTINIGNTTGKVANISTTINFTVPNGSTLWLGWLDVNDPSVDHALGIDDFEIAFVIPEPGTVVLLILGGALVTHRKRRRAD